MARYSGQARNYSEDTANKVDSAVRELIDQALARSIIILQTNRVLLDRSAEALLKTETLNTPEIEKLKQAIVKN